jgi:hypothetical protein
MLTQIDCACAQPNGGDIGFEPWVAGVPPAKAPSYGWERPQQKVALKMIEGMRQITAECKNVGVNITDGSPRPRSELRRRAHV